MSKRSFRRILAIVPFALSACGGGVSESPTPSPAALPPISLAQVGDSVMYLERTESFTLIERPADTLRIRSYHDAVIHVVRTAPDTLEAFYEHLLLRYVTPSQTRNVPTEAMIGPRFVLHEDDGRIETVRAPELSQEIRQLTDLRRQFDDFFLRLPRRPLQVGDVWVDTVAFSARNGDATTDRDAVTRFTVRGDTVVEGIAALVVDYQAVLESNMRTAPTTEGTLASALTGEEEGWFAYAPSRDVMLRRWRVAILEGELRIEGNLDTRAFPQSFGYESMIELIPPAAPRAPRPPEPAPES